MRPMPADTAVQAQTWVHKPTRVQAMQLTAATFRDVFDWMTAAGAYWWAASDDLSEIALWLDSAAPGQDSKIRVRTPQGARKVLMGDWIVRGVAEVWYPVHDEVWRASYEREPEPPMPRWSDTFEEP